LFFKEEKVIKMYYKTYLELIKLKVGDYIILKDYAALPDIGQDVLCTIHRIQLLPPGKHGGSKGWVHGVGVFDDKEYSLSIANTHMPGEEGVEVPTVYEEEYYLLNRIDEDLILLDNSKIRKERSIFGEEIKRDFAKGNVIKVFCVKYNDRVRLIRYRVCEVL